MTAWVTKATACMGPNVYPQVPDGGWGWVVALAFFFVEVFTYGVIKSFGIFLQDLMSHFSESNSRVSWIISICVFIMTFTAPLSSLMSNRFGFRPVVMLGGLLVSLGTITTAFARSIDEMYVTVGVISGLGYCLTFLPTVTILSQYFCRHRSLVTAVASTGESFAMFAFAPAFTALKDRIGWRYCLIVVGVLQASIVFWGALLRPIVIRLKSTEDSGPSPTQLETKYAEENEHTRTSISSEDSGVQSLSTSWINLAGEQGAGQNCSTVEEETPLQETVNQPPLPARPSVLNFSLLRDSSFICYALFGLFATLGFFAPQLYVIELSVSRGVDRDRAAYMLSTMAVAEIFGRLSIGWVLSRRPIRKIYILLICVTLLCLVLVAFYFAMDFWGLSVCCVMYGFLLGTVASTHIPMLAEDDVVGIDRMPSAVGIYVFIQSFAGLAGPPLGGFLVDKSHNYGSAFYSCAVGMGLGALFLGFVLPAKRGLCRVRRKSSQRQEDAVAPSETDSSQGREDIPVEFMEVDLAMDTSPAQSHLEQSTV